MVAFPRLSPMSQRVAPLGGAIAGVTVAALFLAVPAATLEDWVWASGIPALVAAAAPPLGVTARAVLALAGGATAGMVTWSLLYLVFGPGGFLGPKTVANAVPVVRRADAHPDAPPRRPMTAADLGTPLMDVAPTAPVAPPRERPVPVDLDQPLSAFDPGAIPEVPLPAPAKVVPLARASLAPGERIETFPLAMPQPTLVPESRRNGAPAQPSIDALLRRLEEAAGQRLRSVTAR